MTQYFRKFLATAALVLCSANFSAFAIIMACGHQVPRGGASLYPTRTIVNPTNGAPGDKAIINASVTLPSGTPRGQANVSIAGKTVGSGQLDVSGDLKFEFEVPQSFGIGSFPVEVRFLPTGQCEGSSGASTLTVSRATPRLDSVEAVEQPAGRVTVSALLKTHLEGARTIEFLIDGKPFGSAPAQRIDFFSSVAKLSGALPSGVMSNSQVTARFAGDALLNPVSVSKTVDLIKNKVASLRIESGVARIGGTSNIRVSLRSADLTNPGPLANETIQALLVSENNSTLKATAVTDKDGFATLTITLPWPPESNSRFYERRGVVLRVDSPNVQLVGGRVNVPYN